MGFNFVFIMDIITVICSSVASVVVAYGGVHSPLRYLKPFVSVDPGKKYWYGSSI